MRVIDGDTAIAFCYRERLLAAAQGDRESKHPGDGFPNLMMPFSNHDVVGRTSRGIAMPKRVADELRIDYTPAGGIHPDNARHRNDRPRVAQHRRQDPWQDCKHHEPRPRTISLPTHAVSTIQDCLPLAWNNVPYYMTIGYNTAPELGFGGQKRWIPHGIWK